MKIASFKMLVLVSLLFAVVQNGLSIQNSIQNNESLLNQNSCKPNEPRCSGCEGGGSGGDNPGPPPSCCKKDSDCTPDCPEGGYCSKHQCSCVCHVVKVMNNDVRCQVDTDCNMKCSNQGYCKLAS
ncbi:unnamed protein product [Arabidopsis halleri]